MYYKLSDMRFAAAIVVLNQALPLAEAVVPTTLEASVSSSGFSKSSENFAPANAQLSSNRLGRGVGHRRKNRLTVAQASNIVECDPDVGLLSCGHGMYCAASQESALGGVCSNVMSETRIHLQHQEQRDLAGPAPGTGNVYCQDYGSICDCSNWDTATEVGSISCSAGYCITDCLNVCYEWAWSYSNDGTNWEETLCYNFFRPYSQSLCYTFSSETTCSITLNEEECSVCSVTGLLGTDVGGTCGDFDCTNLNMASGDLCEDTVDVPIEDVCGCSICPTTGVSFPNDQVYLPGYGSYQCKDLEHTANHGYLNAITCYAAGLFVNNTCCIRDPTPSPTAMPTTKAPTTSPTVRPSAAPVADIQTSESPVTSTMAPSAGNEASPTSSSTTTTTTSAPTAVPTQPPPASAATFVSVSLWGVATAILVSFAV
eukprot:Nitzschia sp. Nitz4//scaffold54_size114964//74518//75913//NITZ4_003858-RA/size114964-snap-gene-0.206-mRNA-1//1//CDS//3329554372//8331//frame0